MAWLPLLVIMEMINFFVMSQVCRLQDLVRKSEQGLGTAEGHISSLQEAQEILQKELELTRARLRETTDSLYSVEVTMLLENKLCKAESR